MGVKSKRQVKSEQQAAEEEMDKMEEERRSSEMKAEIQAVAVYLSFQISDWLQITFIFISDW